MDIKLEKKKGWRAVVQKKNIPYAVALLLLVFVVVILLRDNSSTLRVDAQLLSIAEVKRGEFNDYVRLTGSVQPITTVQLSPLETGIVERIVAEEGTKVKRGDVIIELSNNNLSMQILQSEADLAEKQNILRNTLISMEQQRLTLRQEQLQLELDVQRKRRTFEQNDELYRSDLLLLHQPSFRDFYSVVLFRLYLRFYHKHFQYLLPLKKLYQQLLARILQLLYLHL